MDHFWNQPHMGENWFTYPALYAEIVKRVDTGSHFVELGSWKGMSASFMAVEIINSGKNIKFDCIDIWSETPYLGEGQDLVGEELMNKFLENIAPVRHVINPIRKDSSTAAADYEDGSIDFVFIDGDHSYEGCKRDILAWLPKMKPNSVFSGHDYTWHEPIQRAVADVFGKGDFRDPWNCGCFIFDIIDGKVAKYKHDNQVFKYAINL
jgi:hypothetical protein